MDSARTDQEKYLAAKAHVEAIKGFYVHAAVFCAVMLGLLGADYAGGGSWWVQWPLLGWGLGVLAHAYFAFSPKSIAASQWEERKIKEAMAKM